MTAILPCPWADGRPAQPGRKRNAELKSMHTAGAARGRGIGQAILEVLLSFARDENYQRVSLETGTMEGFAAARRLYERAGFVPCGPFGDYTASPDNTFHRKGR